LVVQQEESRREKNIGIDAEPQDGLLKEHSDVLQDEATKAESVSGLPMFGDTFPK
jgi:hypothetical protein